tara:strand:- start:426 stop:575 length:150 start_codon:yes stop_codon:yes gene_type:complete
MKQEFPSYKIKSSMQEGIPSNQMFINNLHKKQVRLIDVFHVPITTFRAF